MGVDNERNKGESHIPADDGEEGHAVYELHALRFGLRYIPQTQARSEEDRGVEGEPAADRLREPVEHSNEAEEVQTRP